MVCSALDLIWFIAMSHNCKVIYLLSYQLHRSLIIFSLFVVQSKVFYVRHIKILTREKF